MKIRIFALAKELDYDSKELIVRCNEAGIPVKSSPLASISPEERDVLLAYLDSRDKKTEPETSAPTTAAEPQVPLDKAVSGKVRAIQPTKAPRQPAAETKPAAPTEETVEEAPTAEQPAEELAPEPVAEESPSEEKPVEDATPAAPEQDATPVAETPTSEPAAETVEAETPEPVAQAEPEKAAAEEDADVDSDSDGDEPAAKTESKPKRKPVDPQAPVKPSADDFGMVPGNLGSKIRDMKPRASVTDSGAARKPKPKPRPALPTLAVPPKFKAEAPVKKKDEAPAQKPDVKLTADILDTNSPLAAHLKKSDDKPARGKGKAGESETDDRPRRGRLGGMVEQREQRRQQRKRTRDVDDDDRGSRSQRLRRNRSRNRNVEYKTSALVELPITVRSLSEAMGRPAKDLMTVMFKQGIMAKINDSLDEDTALEVALELGVDLEIKREHDFEEALADRLNRDLSEEQLGTRAPIVTILGHVDHGKTTLVDTLRSSNVASGEAGGITQHIAAYQVNKDGQAITFVDTPGHAAFGEMRARGANVTDIIVLVVAANDGVMPQTIECISHAKAAGVPMIVAMNKIDLPDINEQKVLQELAAQNVLVTEWGGDVELVRTSGLKGQGIDDLLETILLTAELHEYKAAPEIPAHGVCLEAFRDEGRGPLAWMIVQQGTLKVGDIVLCGTSYGRIRAMFTDSDQELTEAPPSTPIKVAGLNTVPNAGDHFFVMDDVEEARTMAEDRIHEGRTEALASRGGPKTLEEILGGSGPKELPLIIKGDTPGSIEALRSEVEKLDHSEVRVEVLHTGVGGVNESDVSLAAASGAIIVAFHVVPEERAETLAQNEGIEIRRYSIIYEVTQDIKMALEGLLAPERVEVTTGRAIVLQTFSISRTGTIAGCRILNGTIDRNDRVHVIRDQAIINNYPIGSLRREKEDVKTVREGMECGIRLDGFNDIKEGDLLEAYRIDELQRTLDD